MSLYWQRLLPVLQPLWGDDVIQAQVAVTRWYIVYQRFGLVISPFVYLLFYLAVMACARSITKTQAPLAVLASRFAFSLVPIALVYHATHYYTRVNHSFRGRDGGGRPDPLKVGALHAVRSTLDVFFFGFAAGV